MLIQNPQPAVVPQSINSLLMDCGRTYLYFPFLSR